MELSRNYCFEQEFYGAFVTYMTYLELNPNIHCIGSYIPEKHEFNTMLKRNSDPIRVTQGDYKRYLQIYRYMEKHNRPFGVSEATIIANAAKRLGNKTAEHRGDLNESARLLDDSVIF